MREGRATRTIGALGKKHDCECEQCAKRREQDRIRAAKRRELQATIGYMTVAKPSVPKIRKIRSDKKYSSNAERQRAYELRKKEREAVSKEAELQEILDSEVGGGS